MSSTPSTSQTEGIHGRYGFAKLDNDVFLVQVNSSPAPKTYQVHVFRHDFVTVFPYSHTQTILHVDLLEVLGDGESGKEQCWLEEDTATVFVAQDVMTRFKRLKDMLVPRMDLWRPFQHRADHRSMDGGGFRSGLATA